MSLIEEALRRAQQPITTPADRDRHKVSPPPPAPAPPPPPPPRQFPSEESSVINLWTSVVFRWAAIGALTCGVVLLAIWTYRLKTLATPPSVVLPAVAQRPATVPPPPRVVADAAVFPGLPPAEQPPMRPELKLTGIVEGVGEPFAIINDHIVRIGELVDGAMLLEIQSDRARLRWRDEEVTLRTTR